MAGGRAARWRHLASRAADGPIVVPFEVALLPLCRFRAVSANQRCKETCVLNVSGRAGATPGAITISLSIWKPFFVPHVPAHSVLKGAHLCDEQWPAARSDSRRRFAAPFADEASNHFRAPPDLSMQVGDVTTPRRVEKRDDSNKMSAWGKSLSRSVGRHLATCMGRQEICFFFFSSRLFFLPGRLAIEAGRLCKGRPQFVRSK